MSTEEFDQKFDEGKEDVTGYLDMSSARKMRPERRVVNVDLPVWMIEGLDHEASRLGITRQSIIKVWLAERLAKAS
ncbi:MAG: type II toxin-antitoxin system BrnA family antitoxin [Thermoleophilia bacterium]